MLSAAKFHGPLLNCFEEIKIVIVGKIACEIMQYRPPNIVKLCRNCKKQPYYIFLNLKLNTGISRCLEKLRVSKLEIIKENIIKEYKKTLFS